MATACQHPDSLTHLAASTLTACEPTRGESLLQLGPANQTGQVAKAEVSSRKDLSAMQLHGLAGTRLLTSHGAMDRMMFLVGTRDDLSITWILFLAVLVCCFSVIMLSWFGGELDPLSKTIRSGIDNLGPRILGVDLRVSSTLVSSVHGWIELRDLIVKNPPGFSSPYLLRVNHIFVDLDTQELWGECLRPDHITVSTVAISGVDFIYETRTDDGFRQTSNVDELLKNLGGPDKASEPQPWQSLASPQHPQDSSKNFVTMLELAVQDVQIKLQAGQLTGATLPVYVENLQYKDFSKELGVYAVDDADRKSVV